MNNSQQEAIRHIKSSPEYSFLGNDQRLSLMGFLTLGGSYAYGTNVEGSDIDLRGMAFNNKQEILTGKDFEQVVSSETDTVIYSFRKLIKLLINCNPNTIELLGCKPESYFCVTNAGRQLLDNKGLFVSQKCINSFGGYANAQLWRLNNLSNRYVSQSEQEKHILKSIQHAAVSWKEQFFEHPEDGIVLSVDKAVNPEYDTEIFMDVNLRHYPLRDYKSLWQAMNNIVKEYNKIGARNKKAVEHNKISKHMMHLVRLYLMCFDILEKGEINTYREKDRSFLLDIRNGCFLDKNKLPTPEFYEYVRELESRLEYDKKNTSIPVEPNYQRVDEFVMSVNEDIVKGE